MKVSKQKQEENLSSHGSHFNSFDPHKTIKFIRSSSKTSLASEPGFSSKKSQLNKEIKDQGYIKMKSLQQTVAKKSKVLDSEANIQTLNEQDRKTNLSKIRQKQKGYQSYNELCSVFDPQHIEENQQKRTKKLEKEDEIVEQRKSVKKRLFSKDKDKCQCRKLREENKALKGKLRDGEEKIKNLNSKIEELGNDLLSTREEYKKVRNENEKKEKQIKKIGLLMEEENFKTERLTKELEDFMFDSRFLQKQSQFFNFSNETTTSNILQVDQNESSFVNFLYSELQSRDQEIVELKKKIDSLVIKGMHLERRSSMEIERIQNNCHKRYQSLLASCKRLQKQLKVEEKRKRKEVRLSLSPE